MGSRIATLFSVAVSNLFGMDELDTAEKKTLVFTDSVQDAAHRAGFVQSGAHRFALRTRTRTRGAVAHAGGVASVDQLPELIIDAADKDADPARARFELLPPQLTHAPTYRGFWDAAEKPAQRRTARQLASQRLAFDIALEFGQRADLPRSLTLTGTVAVEVDASAAAQAAAAASGLGLGLADASHSEASAPLAINWAGWARGVLEYLRTQGAIYHPLFADYLHNDCNAWMLNRPAARAQGIPGFAKGTAPAFPRVGSQPGGKRSWDFGYLPAGADTAWLARWTAKALGTSRRNGARAAGALLGELEKVNLLGSVATVSGATVYYLPAHKVLARIEARPQALECPACHRRIAASTSVREQLLESPCFTPGRLATVSLEDNYYRNMYSATHPRTVVAREHTGMLEKDERLTIEREFKLPAERQRPDAPNVLVATPTLEMGIDIGDLSTVMLSGLPRTVANYVQRVGRAGRLTGNSLVIALVPGRGRSLVKLERPLETIAGKVRPPVAYLSAREILHRQFLAYLIDSNRLDKAGLSPKQATDVFAGEHNVATFLLELIRAGVDTELAAFCQAVRGHSHKDVIAELTEWVQSGDIGAEVTAAKDRWQETEKTLSLRLGELGRATDKLQQRAQSAPDDDKVTQELRATRAQLFATKNELNAKVRGENWLACLERYGLLPNFTLLDEDVELHLDISRFDQDLREMVYDDFRDYSRGATQALIEFAPGATFYAQGLQATIDTVELGRDFQLMRSWRVCPECSFTEAVLDPAATPRACPACGAGGFADAGQVLDVVDLTKAYSSVNEATSSIENFDEERRRAFFQQAVCVVPEGPGESWYLSGTGFGAEYLPHVTMRWLNLGASGEGHTVHIAGQELSAPLFRVCRECGHVDSQAGHNSWRDHRPWCSKRHALEEDTVAFALGRELGTQAVALTIPQLVTAADSATLPSLSAAIMLGLQEFLGGDPDHLDVLSARGTSGDHIVDKLLVYDSVPGGTGYLTQFAQAPDVRGLLKAAYLKLARCTCADEDRLACPNCLLPFAGRDIAVVSRELALAALAKLLADEDHPEEDTDPLSVEWSTRLVDTPPQRSVRSELEAKFLSQLEEDFTAARARVTERAVGGRKRWIITFPGRIEWTMVEQKNYGNTVADFMFSTNSPQLPDIAVFLDGEQFHHSATSQRFSGDFAKRNRLAAQGILPWSMTWSDLERHRAATTGQPVDPPRWIYPEMRAGLAQTFNVSSVELDILQAGPQSLLMAMMAHPLKNWEAVGLAGALQAAGAAGAHQLGQLSVRPTSPSAVELSLTTAPNMLGSQEWHDFLSVANLIYLSGAGSVCAGGSVSAAGADVVHAGDAEIALEGVGAAGGAGVVGGAGGAGGADGSDSASGSGASDGSASGAGDAAPAGTPTEPGNTPLASAWLDVLDEFAGEDDVTKPLELIARAGAPAPDAVGEEIAGIPVIAQWDALGVILVFEGDAAAVAEATDARLTTATAGSAARSGTDRPARVSAASSPGGDIGASDTTSGSHASIHAGESGASSPADGSAADRPAGGVVELTDVTVEWARTTFGLAE